MTPELAILAGNAAVVAVVHTAIGPDHYLPFVVLAKARGWSRARTVAVTAACGAGHVLSSIVLGLVGFAVGAGLKQLVWIESIRGEVAAWSLIAFGLAYAAWGLRRARRAGPDGHTHRHGGYLHASDHVHDPKTGATVPLTPVILFIIFVFGPCEPLIPLFIYPAATVGWGGAALVSAVFALVTIGTMLAAVLISLRGLEFFPARSLERYSHALAGASIALTGGAIQFLGL